MCVCVVACVSTLKSLDPAFSEGHGQVERDVMLMITHLPQELKLKLVQRLPERSGRKTKEF